MDSSNPGSCLQGMRADVLREHWDKFDSIVSTLVGLGASPVDVEEKLHSVFGRIMSPIQQSGRIKQEHAAAKPNTSSTVKVRRAPQHNVNATIKVEDDEDQPRITMNHKPIPVGKNQALNIGQRKRKATDTNVPVDCNIKRPKSTYGKQPAREKTNDAECKDNKVSSSEAPPDPDRELTPAAGVYRKGREVFMRPKVGWQFREFSGTTKVWYNNGWRPLIQDQPDFKGVYKADGGWILPWVAHLSSEKMKRWNAQAKVEFNSPY
ncbi:hypothetical protein Daus18300_001046 [Diaporthe australafricana]|uniref:Uncharacterized protein n=1 Tax=Diaporthe australafricana TaxID=127596 RepID=A0ABR3XZW4_9PEZI